MVANQPTSSIAEQNAQRGFSRSVVISGVRCLLTYLILPFVLPAAIAGVGPVIGLVVGTVAIASNGFSIRRFWRANHKWRKPITAIHVGVIAFLTILIIRDLQELIG